MFNSMCLPHYKDRRKNLKKKKKRFLIEFQKSIHCTEFFSHTGRRSLCMKLLLHLRAHSRSWNMATRDASLWKENPAWVPQACELHILPSTFSTNHCTLAGRSLGRSEAGKGGTERHARAFYSKSKWEGSESWKPGSHVIRSPLHPTPNFPPLPAYHRMPSG